MDLVYLFLLSDTTDYLLVTLIMIYFLILEKVIEIFFWHPLYEIQDLNLFVVKAESCQKNL